MPSKIYADHGISITELKQQTQHIAEMVKEKPLVVLNRNTPVFYCVSPELYNRMQEVLEDAELGGIIYARKDQKRIRVDVDKL